MFAPKVAKPQTKAAEVPTSKLAPRRDCDPVEQALFLQRSIGNQATLRLLTQRALRTEQEIAPENITTREAPRGASWDFSKNSVFPCDRADQPRVGFSLTAPPLPGVIQPKLVIGQVNDPLEHEADRVADQVVRMSGAALSSASAAAQISRKCPAWEEEEAEPLQPKPVGSAETPIRTAPDIVQDVLRTPGQPLDPESRAFFEPRFGNDFSQVRIHADTRAAESARAVDARAYTVGQHVVFGRDRHAPRTADGRHLLAHELAHTLQQRGVAAGLQRAPDDPPASPPPARPDLEGRLRIIEEAGPAAQKRLTAIIETGGPIPSGTKVIGAAIIQVEGYDGHTELRAINGVDADKLGAGAPVYHATTPTDRALTATQGAPTQRGGREPSITGPRRESINPHLNDAEMKLFEYIIPRLPKGAKGTIWFTTVRARLVNGKPVLEPYPACSGCIRASFETAGLIGEVDLVSAAPAHPPLSSGDLGEPGPGEGGDASAPGGQTSAKPAKPSTGVGVEPGGEAKGAGTASAPKTTVEPGGEAKGPGTAAAPKTTVEPGGEAKGAGTAAAPKTTVEPGGEVKGLGTARAPKTTGATAQPGRFTGVGIEVGTAALSLGIGLLSSYLKARVDRRIAAAQIDRNQKKAETVINQQVDVILKMMLTNPEQALYARVYMSSAVITTYDTSGGEPTASDSSPIIDLTGVGFTFVPLDPADSDTFQVAEAGGYHSTVVRLLISEIPLETPPIENLIVYAKARKLSLEDLYLYVLNRVAGLDEKGGPQKYIDAVEHWQHILDLIGHDAPRP